MKHQAILHLIPNRNRSCRVQGFRSRDSVWLASDLDCWEACRIPVAARNASTESLISSLIFERSFAMEVQVYQR